MIVEQDTIALASRGISVSHAARYEIQSATAEELRLLLGRSDLTSGGLVFRYPSYDGEVPLVRVRLHQPIAGEKPQRYIQPKNSINRPFVTASAQAHREDKTALAITEGECKALALEVAGLAAIGLPGCYGWVAPRPKDSPGPPALHPALAAFMHTGRVIFLIPDSDFLSNPKVRQAFVQLANALRALGVIVKLVVIPLGVNGAKIGVDDLLAQRGTAECERLVHEAPLATPGDVDRYIRQHGLDRSLVLEAASSLTVQRLRYLWEGNIPLGMVSMLVGAPGLGKSIWGTELSARLTRGQLAGEFFGRPKPVLITSVEDHKRAVLLPRLIAAGADLSKVTFINGPGGAAFLLPDHLVLLENAVRATGAAFVFVDPLMAHLPGNLNSWKDQDVRRITAPLAELAEHLSIAPVGVIHLNRRDTADVLTRIGGSGAWGAAARSVLVMAEDPDDSSFNLLAQAKLNVGPKHPSLRFRIETRTVDSPEGPAETAALVWSGTSEHRANDLLAPRLSREDRDAVEAAKDFLRQVLADGEVEVKLLEKEATTAGIAVRSLDRARSGLGVKSRRDGTKKCWFCRLPDPVGGKDASKGATPPIYGALGTLGTLTQNPDLSMGKREKECKDAKGIAIEGEADSFPHSLPPLVQKPPGDTSRDHLFDPTPADPQKVSAGTTSPIAAERNSGGKVNGETRPLPPLAEAARKMFDAEIIADTEVHS